MARVCGWRWACAWPARYDSPACSNFCTASCCLIAALKLQELDSFQPSIRHVAIHDVARPLIGAELITKLLTTAENYKNAIPATLITDTVKQINEVPENDNSVIENLDRSKLRSIQTPQIFDFNLIKECYQMVFDADQLITDDSSALTFSDIGIKLLINDQPNPKLTTKNDLDYILYLLNQNPL